MKLGEDFSHFLIYTHSRILKQMPNSSVEGCSSRLHEAAVRFSPQRTTVFFPKPFVAAEPSDAASLQRVIIDAGSSKQQNDEIGEDVCEELLNVHDHHRMPLDSHSRQLPLLPLADEDEKKDVPPKPTCTEDGLPILAMHSCTIPDPSITATGHAVASLYFYGCFLLAVTYAIWRFASFDEIVSVSMPLTSTLGLSFPMTLNISCGIATNVTLLLNYSTPCVQGLNYSSGTLMKTVPLGAAPVGGVGSVVFDAVPLCYSFQDSFVFTDRWPSLAGVAVAFDSVPWGSSCIVEVFAGIALPGQQQEKVLIHALGVEGGMVKSFYMSYTAVTIVQDKNRLDSASLEPVYYELDGVRSTNNIDWGLPGADSSSVVAFRLSEVSRHISRNDYRTVFKFLGFFGQVWGLVGKAMLVLGPMLVVLCPRDFVADAKAGRIEGYTKFLLDDAWKPGILASFGLDLFTRIKSITQSK